MIDTKEIENVEIRPIGLSLAFGDVTYHQGDLIKILINDDNEEGVAEIIAFDLTPDDRCPILCSFRYLKPQQIPHIVDTDGAEPRFSLKSLEDNDYDPTAIDVSRYIGDEYGWCGLENVVGPLGELENQLVRLEHEIAAQP